MFFEAAAGVTGIGVEFEGFFVVADGSVGHMFVPIMVYSAARRFKSSFCASSLDCRDWSYSACFS